MAANPSPPARIDVLDLRIEIDDACQAWQPAGQSTPDRLRALVARRWRPQDTAAVEQIAAGVESWTARIGVLLSPQRVKHVSAPCPACSATHIYRKDSLGETVRVPALQITTQGCVCVACNATWAPDRYLFLCRMLGFELPKGVLE